MEKTEPLLDHPLLKIGSTVITLQEILLSLAILLAAFAAAWGVRRFAKKLQERVGEERAPTIYVSAQVVRYIVVITGVALSVSALGVNLTALSLFAGALGVGIGLGLQDVVRNFVCGIILLFDRSIEVGDFIEMDQETRGSVINIGPRATTILTNDNVDILVPNADLLNGRLKNWTRGRTGRRIHIPFGVAYGSDKDLVRKAVLEAAQSVPFTLPESGRQRSQVWLVGFGDSSLDFQLVVWPSLEAVKRPGSMMAAYNWAIEDALRKYGIEIPFPQRDLRMRGFFEHVGEDGLQVWRGEEAVQARGREAGPDSENGINDAVEDVHEAEKEEQEQRERRER